RRVGVLPVEGDGPVAAAARGASRLPLVRTTEGALPRPRDARGKELGERACRGDALASAQHDEAQRLAERNDSRSDGRVDRRDLCLAADPRVAAEVARK